ncbi:MAG TPA: hypothetical protein VHF58_03145, partial [Solirubrobacterales bacterium]|nr:hypothetical protein [Solirubrobacterales bacterium]
MGTITRIARGALAALTELLKVAREMLVIPAQVWLLVAEILGAAVLRIWLAIVLPVLRTAWSAMLTLYYASIHKVTPRRTLAAVGIAAAVALVASQWLDYRSVSVGTPAYQGEVDLVAPAPDVDRDRAGEAHAWVMLPIAALGALGVALAYARHPRAAWLTIASGLGAIAIAVGIDAPKGLDEGAAEVAYQGASAQLLEGFWAQIASGAALAGVGLLSLAYGRRERAPARRRT